MTGLRLKRLDEREVRITRAFDYSLALSVEIGAAVTGATSYWRQMDPEFSLVEIGLDEEEGSLLSVTVPLYNGLLYPYVPDSAQVSGRGLPIFDAPGPGSGAGAGANLFDVPGRCRLELGAGLLRLALLEGDVATLIEVGDGLQAEFDARSQLIGFRLTGLTARELTGVANAIQVIQ